jgi:ABC-type Zn2+ transport system substrate-binding protein/surface adhesin
MASETLRLTAQIIMSHASMTELTPKELVAEIKQLYHVLAALEDEVEVTETKPPVPRGAKPRKGKMAVSPEAKAVRDEEAELYGGEDQQEFMASREG